MSVEVPRQMPEARSTHGSEHYTGYSEGHGEGWVTFAGVMLGILSIMNVIGGIAAIDNANVYAGSAHYTFGDLNTWGWVLLCTGVVQGLAAVGIWMRNQFARWLGVGFVSLNIIAQFLFMPAFPLWAISMLAVDTLVVYGLVAYGGREDAA